MKAPARHHARRRERPEAAAPARRRSRCRAGTHSHKVRAANGLMLVNREGHGAAAGRGRASRRARDLRRLHARAGRARSPSGARGGARRAPLHLRRPLRLHLAGDGRLRRQHRDDPRSRRSGAARRRSGAGGCRGSGRPAARRRRGRGASTAATIRSAHGNRLYVSYWHGGFVILDIEDMAQAEARLRPRLEPAVHHADAHRAAGAVPAAGPPRACWWPTRTWPSSSRGRRRSCGWWTSPTRSSPVPFASFQVAGVDGTPQPEFTGCHQPVRDDHGHRDPGGVVRLRAAHRRHRRPARAARGRALPAGRRRPGTTACRSNDVFVDDRGLIYLIDRGRGSAHPRARVACSSSSWCSCPASWRP